MKTTLVLCGFASGVLITTAVAAAGKGPQTAPDDGRTRDPKTTNALVAVGGAHLEAFANAPAQPLLAH